MKENDEPISILDTDYKKLIEPYKEEAFETLRQYISIDSTNDQSTVTEKTPFGAGVEKALSFIAGVGEKMGFSVDRCDGYCTELTYGEGDKIFDVYAHCDVVPVERENWVHDPFTLTLEGNSMYGRGTSDDKGPGLACLYAIKALMDAGKIHGYKLRYIVGGDEERGSACLHHYFEELHRGYPTLGIAPDSDFPVDYAEKSLYFYQADYDDTDIDIDDFEAGTALNIVLAHAKCRLRSHVGEAAALIPSYLEEYPEIKINLEGDVLHFDGVPYHGSMPWGGVNAGLHLLNFLGRLFNNRKLIAIFKTYETGRGEIIGGNFSDADFEESSYNVGKVIYHHNVLSLQVNVRYPVTYTLDEVINNLKAKTTDKITILNGSEGIRFDLDSPFMNILISSYREETGDYESKPLAIGGGTYARESKNSVAYGCIFPGRDYRMHGNDEFFPLTDFYNSMQIYAHALDKISEYLRSL